LPQVRVLLLPYLNNPDREIAALLDFCRLRANGGAAAHAATIRTELRHQRSDTTELLACDQISNETKLLYLRLRGLAAAGEISPAEESGSDDAISELLRLLDNSAQHQLVGGLQSRLNRSEAEFANLRTEMWRDIKANHRWGYRFYRKVLRPFQLSRYRSSR